MKTIVAAFLTCAICACAKNDKSAGDSTGSAATPPAEAAPPAMKMGETGGMDVPESVKYDSTMDVFFVSNIVGTPSVKDGKGFIAVVRADSTNVMRMLVESGKTDKALVLNAPKGLAITADTLWVADIDVVHAINKRT